MNVVVAVDSFKGSMTSMEAGMAAREGILAAKKDAEVVVCPLADGGEGTTEALVEGLDGRFVETVVCGPLGDPVRARYGILDDKKTAVMEMAQAAGIILVDRNELDPWRASTTGLGEMICDAIKRGCREFLIGIGGSATTEAGIGMLEALGYAFYDKDKRPLEPVLSNLGGIKYVDDSNVVPELSDCRFHIACDVKNPLCGENGAVYVYGPQKGIKEEEKKQADALLRGFAEATIRHTGHDHTNVPGAGAAGGLGFAFLSYLPNVELRSGIDMILDAIHLDEKLVSADIVVTGEGRLDAQTAMGKAPVGVACRAKKYGCRVIAFAGGVTDDASACNENGIDAFFPTVRGITTIDEVMVPKTAKKNMRLCVEQVFRLL